jgi:uncharacterized protein YdaL
MKYLPELVNQMERIPGGEWLDLKKTKQTVNHLRNMILHISERIFL